MTAHPRLPFAVSEVVITRACAPPTAWTFKSRPIKALLDRYVGDGKGWVDPFAGRNSPAEFTNDHDPEANARWHMEAETWCKGMACGLFGYDAVMGPEGLARHFPDPPYRGVLFDPPYSYRQVSEHYKRLGMKASQLDTSANFYNRVKNAICDSIMPGGLAISFGWDSSGFGKNRGFEIVEILMVNHGQSHHYDTIVTVERRAGGGDSLDPLIVDE